MEVVFFQRKPHRFHFSIEAIFEGIRKHLPAHVTKDVQVCPHPSEGILNRLRNTLWAKQKQGQLNHITGDVHFLAILLETGKTILTIHDCGFMDNSSPVAKKILWLFWLKWPVGKSRVVTTISESTKKDIVRYTGCNPNKIRVIPDFISEVFKAAPFMFNAQQPRCLIIGTKHNKNIPRIIQALKDIPCELSIVGEKRPELLEMIEQAGLSYQWRSRISMEEMYQCYVEADLLLFPSTLEGFGMPIIEAQTVGRPVVTSNISSMPEVAGEGACLVDPYSVASIREGVLRVINDDAYREGLIAKGRKNCERFQPQKVADMYYELYREVFSG